MENLVLHVLLCSKKYYSSICEISTLLLGCLGLGTTQPLIVRGELVRNYWFRFRSEPSSLRYCKRAVV